MNSSKLMQSNTKVNAISEQKTKINQKSTCCPALFSAIYFDSFAIFRLAQFASFASSKVCVKLLSAMLLTTRNTDCRLLSSTKPYKLQIASQYSCIALKHGIRLRLDKRFTVYGLEYGLRLRLRLHRFSPSVLTELTNRRRVRKLGIVI